jgi:hypothetical protein
MTLCGAPCTALKTSKGAMATFKGIQGRRVHASVYLTLVALLSTYRQSGILTGYVGTASDKPAKPTSSGISPDAFHSDNLGWPERVPCGKNKCLYRLKTDPQIGYLVVPWRARPSGRRDRYTALNLGWLLAQELQKEYDIRHLYLAPPENATVTEELEEHLNYNLWSEQYQQMLSGKMRQSKLFHNGSKVHAQKVQLAPRRHLMMGCVESKAFAFLNNLPNFLSFVEDKGKFLSHIQQHLVTARVIMDNHPCMVKDFQVMITTEGDVYHLDFDRCFTSKGELFSMSQNYTDSCLQTLGRMKEQLQEALYNDTECCTED